MEHTSSGANRMALLAEITAFTREHGNILARYHTNTMDDLKKIEKECWRLHDEACSRGACGSAGVTRPRQQV